MLLLSGPGQHRAQVIGGAVGRLVSIDLEPSGEAVATNVIEEVGSAALTDLAAIGQYPDESLTVDALVGAGAFEGLSDDESIGSFAPTSDFVSYGATFTITDTVVDGYSSAYDRDGNVVTKNNVGYANANSGSTAFNENYTYDNLSQLINVSRGTNSNFAKYQVDALGNMTNTFEVSTDDSNIFNSENQMTAFAGTALAYDNNGNLTTDQNGDTLVYDAWNRLVAVYNSTGLLIKAYQYDGLGRLITETDGTHTTDLYYSSNWQVIEERTGVSYPYLLSTGSNGTVSAEYVYSPVYVNAPIVWNKDTDGDGTLDRQLYYTSDANYDVTSVIDTGGTVQERVVYDAYGNASFYSSTWSTLSSDSLSIRPLWQGGWFDSAIGSYDFEHRWYNPTLMRWLTVDPTGYSDGLNGYSSIGDNPINRVDPSGNVAIFFEGGGTKQVSKDPPKVAPPVGGYSTAWSWVDSDFDYRQADMALEFVKKKIAEAHTCGIPVVIIGYSAGGYTALKFARTMADAGYHVDLLVTIDAVEPDPLGGNLTDVNSVLLNPALFPTPPFGPTYGELQDKAHENPHYKLDHQDIGEVWNWYQNQGPQAIGFQVDGADKSVFNKQGRVAGGPQHILNHLELVDDVEISQEVKTETEGIDREYRLNGR